jgi:hypothetical protein
VIGKEPGEIGPDRSFDLAVGSRHRIEARARRLVLDFDWTPKVCERNRSGVLCDPDCHIEVLPDRALVLSRVSRVH